MRKLPFVSTLVNVHPFVGRLRSILDDGGAQVVVDGSASIGDANNITLTYGYDWMSDAPLTPAPGQVDRRQGDCHRHRGRFGETLPTH